MNTSNKFCTPNTYFKILLIWPFMGFDFQDLGYSGCWTVNVLCFRTIFRCVPPLLQHICTLHLRCGASAWPSILVLLNAHAPLVAMIQGCTSLCMCSAWVALLCLSLWCGGGEKKDGASLLFHAALLLDSYVILFQEIPTHQYCCEVAIGFPANT